MFSSKNFIVLALTFWPLICLVNFCIRCEVRIQFHSFACGYPVVSAQFFKKVTLSPLSFLGTLVENQLTVNT